MTMRAIRMMMVVPFVAGGTHVFAQPILYPVNGHYYDIISGSQTWNSAATLAQQRGGYLATITDEAENGFVVERILTDAPGLNWAIGGLQADAPPEPDGGWTWLTGEPWNYANWMTGEPSNSGTDGGEEALMIYSDANFGRLGRWNDVSRTTVLDGVVVEFDRATFYFDGNGHSYAIVESGLSWDAARVDARALGGYLATITSDAEDAFITGSVLPRALGLNYAIGGVQPSGSAEPTGGWSWITGEPWEHISWGSGEPNNSGLAGAENGLMVYADYSLGRFGLWNDVNRSFQGDGILSGYILEFGPEHDQGAGIGDLDRDGYVDLGDLAQLLSAFGLCDTDPGFVPEADFTANGCINLSDLAVLLAHFGQD